MIVREKFDIIEDAIATQLIATSDEQAIIDPDLAFNVFTGQFREPESRELPAVNIYTNQVQPGIQSSARGFSQDEITYWLDLYAQGAEDTIPPGGGNPKPADQDAGKRLNYLWAQVRNSIYLLDKSNFGQDTGEIGKKTYGSFQRFLQDTEMSEQVAAGRFMFTISVSYNAPELDKPDLERVDIDAGLYETQHDYN